MANFENSNFVIGSKDFVVAEVDESDGTLIHFKPSISVLLNISREHMSHYKDIDNLFATYLQFLLNTRHNGVLLINSDDPLCVAICEQFASLRPDVWIIRYSVNDLEYFNSIEKKFFDKRLNIYGAYKLNAMIATKVYGALNAKTGYTEAARENYADEADIKANYTDEAQAGYTDSYTEDFLRKCISDLFAFRGISRRFEYIGMYRGAVLMDDYAHHPNEILAIRNIIQELKKEKRYAKYYCILQPHKYSRFADLIDDFAKAYIEMSDAADGAFIMDVYSTGEKIEEYLSGFDMKDFVKQKLAICRDNIYYSESEERLIEQLDSVIEVNDCVIFIGAGDVTYIPRKLVEM